MTATAARLDLSELGADVAIKIACLEGDETAHGIARMLDFSGVPSSNDSVEPLQLLEESEYLYEVENLPEGSAVELDPVEIFSRDSASGATGRIRTGRSVGRVVVVASASDGREARAAFEVRSRKLGYLDDFRWMLDGISSTAADVLLSEFAPAGVKLDIDWSDAPRSLYPRFALLRAAVSGQEFDGAVSSILRDPHSEYRESTQMVDPSLGVRGGPSLARELIRPGPRTKVDPELGLPLESLPLRLIRTEHVETHDTTPNQFARYALESWRNLADEVTSALETVDSDAARRGVREAADLRRTIDLVLSAPLFAEVGELGALPSSNQVLQRRAGYRELFRLFLRTEAAAALEWGPDDEVFPAGSKDVATLYEYWTYLELARVIESLGFSVDWSDLIEESESGLVLNLSQGRKPVLVATGVVKGRTLKAELFYNKTFNKGSGSWTRSVRPDCSLRLEFENSLSGDRDTWLHFDAKYRIRGLAEVVGSDDQTVKASGGDVLTDDLFKMHTYRDAIERTVGSFVMYPGAHGDAGRGLFERYHEILPGLGAFALRPTSGGGAAEDQVDVLRVFLSDVIDHMAARGTAIERAEFWTARSFAEPGRAVTPTNVLELPPADTPVLVGYVKSEQHRLWMEDEGLYNLRADDRAGSVDLSSDMLRANFLLAYSLSPPAGRLYRLSPGIVIRTAPELAASGYPSPRGDRYACLTLAESMAFTAMSERELGELARRIATAEPPGAPSLATWSDVFVEEVVV